MAAAPRGGGQDVLDKLSSLSNPDGTARKRAVRRVTGGAVH